MQIGARSWICCEVEVSRLRSFTTRSPNSSSPVNLFVSRTCRCGAGRQAGSGGAMSSPAGSSGTPGAALCFEELWRQLGECHQTALQDLEAKVSKLKKERCLDAKRLEVFYNRSQQLKEENQSLQEAISLLEDRLHKGECDRCATLEETLRNSQNENSQLITNLKSQSNSLKDENRKLLAELQNLKMSRSELQLVSSPEPEDGIIPDSPILHSSLPVANRLKKRRNIDKIKHVRYAEVPHPLYNSLFSEVKKEPVHAMKKPGPAEVFVPNTCQLDISQNSSDDNLHMEEAIAETCGLELVYKAEMKSGTAADQQSSSKSIRKTISHLNPDSPTERSPSLLPRCVKRFSEDISINEAKRKKEESEPVQEGDKQGSQGRVDSQREAKHKQPELIRASSTPLSSQSVRREPADTKDQSAQNRTSNQHPNASGTSPAFKKPNVREAKKGVGRGNAQQDVNASHEHHRGEHAERKHKVEATWSLDPALGLSMYDSEWRGDEPKEEELCHGDMADTDCTWVSHSLLQGRGGNEQDAEDSVPGLGKKANDSLDMMFDTTAYGEYKSYNESHLGQSQPCEEGSEEEEEEEDDEQDPQDSMSQHKAQKSRRPAFAHVAVIRNKEERRKLKGTTCKECEIYYAHLPEEEKQKKLSACSRHRFLYIPPSTPENFWEVGFPSTQTCIERGYIKEEENPQSRTRRRLPLNALFSPKRSLQSD